MKQTEKVMSKIDLPIKNNSILDRWKQEIVTGNQCLIAKDFQAAASRYELARQFAETIFKDWVNPNEAVSALVVTYHNIADLQRKIGNAESILFYLEKAHQIVLKALVSTPVNNGQRYCSLLSASKRTYSALLGHKKCCVFA